MSIVKQRNLIRRESMSSNASGEISFIYKEDINNLPIENTYELPASLPTAAAPRAPPLRQNITMASNDALADLVRALQTLGGRGGGDNYITDQARESRSGKVPVEIRTSFVRVIDVDTCKQHFEAEIFLQARWQEPALAGMSQLELDDIDLRGYWDPLLRINNIVGDLHESKKWRKAMQTEPGCQNPSIIFRQRARGTFVEPLELKNFPVDVQALTLKVISDRGNKEIAFVEDSKEISCVSTDNFTDELEWLIYEHVDTTIHNHSKAEEYYAETHGKVTMGDIIQHPSVDFKCHVARRPGYFLWNIILVIGFMERQKMVDKDEEYYYRLLKFRERRGRRSQQAPPTSSRVRPAPREKPKIVYINADKQNDLSDLLPQRLKKPKKQKPMTMPPPNFPPREGEKVFTINRESELRKATPRLPSAKSRKTETKRPKRRGAENTTEKGYELTANKTPGRILQHEVDAYEVEVENKRTLEKKKKTQGRVGRTWRPKVKTPPVTFISRGGRLYEAY
ncbi:hypothetical protein CAPTEDRAFT_226672 [Capitella teleta]|uniref:Neurotransmitter-gated ion-channel ligand-binding domain-containing protein n=1 Tax=Capitella teleta TaxID=283909 RepID=R7VKQ9_CAPTE|nr:hypothetical protein CAPTEDRAFT_226672 [Capitella teleta]|eukprot:ELU16975.1 hypothetical protein CAPTEDRAFT_226672 [Capitella teleta]